MGKNNSTLVYGLGNCDGCRKARQWFDAKGHSYVFEDIRDPANTAAVIARIGNCADWPAFVNRRSTTWRNLPDARKNALDRESALALLSANPTLIKRPVIVIGDATLAGFAQDVVAARLA